MRKVSNEEQVIFFSSWRFSILNWRSSFFNEIFWLQEKRLSLKPKDLDRVHKIHNFHNIEEKNYIKYLGIYIDSNLNWAPHIQHIKSKISKNLGILFRLCHFLNLNTLKQIYYSLIYPYLHYGIMSWRNIPR